MATTTHSPLFLARRKFFLFLPAVVIPSLLLLFYSFAGGKAAPTHNGKDSVSGFNANLPGPAAGTKNQPQNKKDVYQKADADSVRRKESERQDPYHAQPIPTAAAVGGGDSGRVNPAGAGCPTSTGVGGMLSSGALTPVDTRADTLLQKLALLQKELQQRVSAGRMQAGGLRREGRSGGISRGMSGRGAHFTGSGRDADDNEDMAGSEDREVSRSGDDRATAGMRRLEHLMKTLRLGAGVGGGEGSGIDSGGVGSAGGAGDGAAIGGGKDPQLEKLNGMLDKIIRIQHPSDKDGNGAADSTTGDGGTGEGAVSAIPAVVVEDQVLVAGATIALRLTEAAVISGRRVPRDQLVYGMVSINQDRMAVTIQSIRQEHVLIPTALQVYDMDGLPGIHIPNDLNRDVARQSADEGVSTVGVTSADPTLGGQAASAGIQAARTLLSRKVRLVRVSVKAGYQVLLKDVQVRSGRRGAVGVRKDSVGLAMRRDSLVTRPTNEGPGHNEHHEMDEIDGVGVVDAADAAASGDAMAPFLHHRVHAGKVELILQGTYLREGMLWFSLLLHNHSAIDYVPQYSLWTVRDRRVVARTANQAIQVMPVYTGVPAVVRGDSACHLLIGFRPFALAHDKELVWEIAEKDGARMLGMTMGEKVLLKTKKL